MDLDVDMVTSNEFSRQSVRQLPRHTSDTFDEDSDVFETSELQDDVFSLSVPTNSNTRTPRTRNNRRFDFIKSSSDISDTELFDSSELTHLDMFSLPSPNEESGSAMRDVSSPTSIASRSSTATFPGSRTGTPMMDQTLSAAFRDKIRSRLKSAKQKARRKSVREELLEKQEQELNEEIDTRLSSRSEWRINIGKVLESQIKTFNENNVSREEAYDFFVNTDRNHIKEKSKPVVIPITSAKKTHKDGEVVEEVEDEDKRLLVSDIFYSTDNWKIHEMSKTVFKTRKERIIDEEKFLFIPSDSVIDLNENKIAEDGLYVEEVKDNLSHRNINKLKDRILKEGLKDKFLDDSSAFILNYNKSEIKNSVNLFPNYETDERLITRSTSCHLRDTFESSSDIKYELIIKVISLTFTSHHLFSEEHTLSRQLIEFYNVYTSIVEKNIITTISQKLHSLFITAKNLNSDNISYESDVNKRERIEVNKSLLMKTFNERNEIIWKLRNILLQLLNTWDQLQRVRNIQNFAVTNVTLICVEDIDININREKKMLTQLVEEGIELEKYLLKQNEEKAQEEYRRDLRNWKQWQRNKRRISNKSESSEIIEQIEQSVEPIRPEPPQLSYDETKIIEKIRNNTLLVDGRLPGEPKFSKITIETNETNLKFKDLPKSEQRRQNDLLKRKYNIQLFLNDKLYCQTIDKESNLNFIIFWNQIFNIKIKNSSSKLKFCVNEKQNLSTNHLADIYVTLPDGLTNMNNSKPLKLEFASNHSYSDTSKHSIINGVIECMIYWEIDSNGLLLCPSDLALNNKNFSSLSKNLQNLNLDDLKQWIQQLSTQDPNDPNNITIIDNLKNYKQLLESNEHFQKCFQLDPLMKEFDFVSDEEIENNCRFRLLKLRSQGIPNYKGHRFVPLNEKQIPISYFQKKVKSEALLKSKKGYEQKREKATMLLTKVREQLIRQSQGTFDRPRTLEDMVIEEEVPSIGMIGFNLLSAQNKRPLNPYRKERKKIGANLIGNSEIKIIITIMHALNVPLRSQSESNSNRTSNVESDLSNECKVCPFVETVFQRESSRTNTAEGPKPTWNETLSLKFKLPEISSSTTDLTKISDCIYLNLFDEIVLNSEENITNEGQKVVQKRAERRWLGSLKIPFSTLYLNGKIEGTFSLNTPVLLLGYEYDTKGWLLGAQSGGHNSSDTSRLTYLTLFVTIDPSLQLPEPLVLKCDTIESESLMLYAKKWQNKLNEQFPNRNIKALAVDINAKLVLVSRFLRSLKPPEDFISNSSASNEIMQRLARFVSLIPKVPDSIALPGICDIWCTSDQFLEMLMGDEEEHAMLLCNFFLYLGKRAAILLGYGIPEGSTAYVIVFEYGQDPYIFNASTGQQFSVRDNYLPLNSIGCIITPENVYANIAKHDHPNRLNFDINKTSDWQPFFNKNFPMPTITSIQPEKLDYGSIDYDNALQLQEKLEKHLRESLMRWRKRSRTFFNRHCIQSIKKILPRIEKNVGKIQQNDLIQDLHDILVIHEMTGFPLNMPYTDLKSITEAVFATGVHLAEDKRVEFALAVYIHPYPCSIFSVWVYIAALTPHTQI